MVSVKQTVPIKQTKKNKTTKVKKRLTKIVKTCEGENLVKRNDQEIKNNVKITNKIKYIMPSSSVTDDLILSTLNALNLLSSHYKTKNSIFGDETPIFAEINCIKIQSNKGNVKFVLPHSTIASTGEVCLITPDLKKGKKVDHEPTIDHWDETLRKAGVTNVKTILPMRQLRVEYDQYELKRRLLTLHDFIMVDTRVINHVSHLLGKMFFKKHNMLIPVRLNEKANLKRDIDVGLRTAMLRLNVGQTSTIIIGHTGMPQNKLKDNIKSLIDQLRDKYPGGDANIRSISIKLPLSLSLPLFLTLRPSNAVKMPKLKKRKPKNYITVEDELSTMPGKRVSVAPDGTVRVKQSENSDESDMEVDTENDGNNKNEESK